MSIWIRNAIYLGILVVALPWLAYRRIRTGRYRHGLRQKLWGLSKTDLTMASSFTQAQDVRTVWFHGVSVGEVQLLAPLIRKWKTKHANDRCVLSVTTDTGMELAQKLLPEVFVFYCPFDFSWAIRRTLRNLQADCLVLGELELWPNMIACAHQCRLPVSVINGRLSERSYRGYQRFRSFTRPMFQRLALVAAQSKTYAERFQACGAESSVTVTGNLKFDNVDFGRSANEVIHLGKIAGIRAEHRVVIVGSTQDPEELAAARAFLQLRNEYPSVRLIVVPRHPDRFDEVHKKLETLIASDRSDAVLMRRSIIQEPIDASDWSILLVDTIGELRWWWGLAEIAVVGGSFGSRGGQNMLEPAAYGANVAFGPNTSNFKDIVELLLQNKCAQRIESLETLDRWLVEQLRDPKPGRHRGERAQQLVAQQQGALELTIQHLEGVLANAAPNSPPFHDERKAA